MQSTVVVIGSMNPASSDTHVPHAYQPARGGGGGGGVLRDGEICFIPTSDLKC